MMQKTNKPIPEPRVFAKPLPLSGLVKLVGNKKAVLWIEAKCGGECEPKILAAIKYVKDWGSMAVFTDGGSMWLDVYNKTWRAWFLRDPTDAERKHAPAWRTI